jgi:hypothetical protein
MTVLTPRTMSPLRQPPPPPRKRTLVRDERKLPQLLGECDVAEALATRYLDACWADTCMRMEAMAIVRTVAEAVADPKVRKSVCEAAIMAHMGMLTT